MGKYQHTDNKESKEEVGAQAAKPTWLLTVHRGRHFLADCMAGGCWEETTHLL